MRIGRRATAQDPQWLGAVVPDAMERSGRNVHGIPRPDLKTFLPAGHDASARNDMIKLLGTQVFM